MHRIVTDPNVKPSKDAQRRLNPNMKEVVKKKVLKWLDAGIIYPISDSKWVDPLELYLTDENEEILDIAEVQEIQECLVSSLDHQRPPRSYKVEPLPANFDTATKPSLEVPPTL
nr:putative reverse transcriptase domain, zinc finger, CCHC-type, retrotransposon Gag domain protein [Tanacetum cinerariifolium]